ncbi:MAG: hypothetical protein R3Y07_09815 [Eubacteriales bacterium]
MENLTYPTPEDPCFQRVWGRVMGECDVIVPTPAPLKQSPPSCYSDCAALPVIGAAIDCICESVISYQMLHRTIPKNCRKYTTYLIATGKQHLAELKTAYYLICGERYVQKIPTGDMGEGVLVTLRNLFIGLSAWKDVYQTWGISTCDPCLTTLFMRLEGQTKDQIDCVKKLVELLMIEENCR